MPHYDFTRRNSAGNLILLGDIAKAGALGRVLAKTTPDPGIFPDDKNQPLPQPTQPSPTQSATTFLSSPRGMFLIAGLGVVVLGAIFLWKK